MKVYQKIYSVLLIFMLSLFLFSCSSSDDNDSTNDTSNNNSYYMKVKINGTLHTFTGQYTIVPPENRTVSLVEKKQLNLQYVTAKKIQFRIQI
jgi:hypothetical protein